MTACSCRYFERGELVIRDPMCAAHGGVYAMPSTSDKCITLSLPWTVLCPDNAKYGVMRGRALLTTRYRTAKEAAATLALAQMRSGRRTAFPRDCALSMSVTLYPPDKRRRDVLNVGKNLGDALEGICYADDAQLDEVTYRRGPLDRANARAEIVISPIPEAQS